MCSAEIISIGADWLWLDVLFGIMLLLDVPEQKWFRQGNIDL